jgi:hypothetical protein
MEGSKVQKEEWKGVLYLNTHFVFQIHSLLFYIPIGLDIHLFQIQIYFCKANFAVFLGGARDFSLLHSLRPALWPTHPDSYAVGTGDSLPGG